MENNQKYNGVNMIKLNKFRTVLLAIMMAFVAVFCGIFLTACNNGTDSGGTGGGDGEIDTPALLRSIQAWKLTKRAKIHIP